MNKIGYLFYHEFYGEGFEINPGFEYTRGADDRPFAGIVWSGAGTLNGLELNAEKSDSREFLVTPGHSAAFSVSKGGSMLLIYCVFPFTCSFPEKGP